MFVTSRWSISRKNFLPLISPETTSVPLNKMKVIMIDIALDIIEKANNFSGFPCSCDDNYTHQSADSPLTISFSLLFSSEQQLSDFVKKVFEKP